MTAPATAPAVIRLAEAIEAAISPDKQSAAALLRSDAAAERLGITVEHLYKLVRRGELQGVRIGKLINIPAEEVDRFIEANRTI